MSTRKEIITSSLIFVGASACLGVFRSLLANEFHNEAIKAIYVMCAVTLVPGLLIFLVLYFAFTKRGISLSHHLSSPKKTFAILIVIFSFYGLAVDIAKLDVVGGIITVIISTLFAGIGAMALKKYFQKKVPDDASGLQ